MPRKDIANTIAVATLLLICRPVAAQDQDSASLLKKWAEWKSRVEVCEASWSCQIFETGKKFKGRAQLVVTEQGSLYRWDDERFRCRCRRHSKRMWKGKYFYNQDEFEYLVGDETCRVTARAPLEEARFVESTASGVVPPIDGEEIDKLQYGCSFSFSDQRKGANRYFHLSPLIHSLPSDSLPLLEVMSTADVCENDEINGIAAVRLQVSNEHGRYSVWIEPQSGLPLRTTCEKEKQHTYLATTVGQLERHDRLDAPPRRFKTYSFDLVVDEWGCMAGSKIPIVKKFTQKETHHYANGAKSEEKNVVTIDSWIINPKKTPFEITMHPPEGSSVNIRDNPEIECVWKDGEIRRVSDDTLVSDLFDF